MRRIAGFTSVALLALLLAACGGDEQPSDDPSVILQRSVAAVPKVTSFHFDLTHENGTTPMPLNLQLVRAEGDVVVPDRLAADVKAKAAAVNVTLKVTAIGDMTWVTNPFSRRWERLPGATLKDIADPTSLMLVLVRGLQDVRLAGQVEVDGEKTFRLAGSLDSGALKSAVPTAEAGHPVSVDLWVGRRDWLPRRARLAGRLSSAEAESIVRQISFSRFNAGVEITPPAGE